jgi:sRNA-binding protein
LLISDLARRFPATFTAEPWLPHRPLKIGVRHDLLAAGFTPAEVKAALRCYVTRRMYLAAVAAGGPRFDLAGNPVGEVSADDCESACTRLAAFDAARAKKAAATRAAREAERQAARQRRETEQAAEKAARRAADRPGAEAAPHRALRSRNRLYGRPRRHLAGSAWPTSAKQRRQGAQPSCHRNDGVQTLAPLWITATATPPKIAPRTTGQETFRTEGSPPAPAYRLPRPCAHVSAAARLAAPGGSPCSVIHRRGRDIP